MSQKEHEQRKADEKEEEFACPKCGSPEIIGDHIERGVGFETNLDKYFCVDCDHNWDVETPKGEDA